MLKLIGIIAYLPVEIPRGKKTKRENVFVWHSIAMFATVCFQIPLSLSSPWLLWDCYCLYLMLSDSWLIIHFHIFFWTCSPSILVLSFITRGEFQTWKFSLFAQGTAARHQMFLLSFKSDCSIMHVKSSSKSKHAYKSEVIWVELSSMRLLGWI